MPTIVVDDDFTIEADEIYAGQGEVFDLVSPNSTNDSLFVNYGTIEATGDAEWGYFATAIHSNSYYGDVENRGDVVVHLTMRGTGVVFDQPVGRFTNYGSISVAADWAYGFTANYPSAEFDNRGEVRVSGVNVVGVQFDYGRGFTNTGSVVVSGSDTARGVVLGDWSDQAVVNDGLISATASDSLSYGLYISGFETTHPDDPTIINYGKIEADIAIAALGGAHDNLINYGEIIGNVMLGEGDDVFGNLGQMTGDLDMGAGDDFVELRNVGVMVGAIRLGDGDDIAFLGDAGQEVWGGVGRDTIRGGIGDDTLHGDQSGDRLSGDAGDDVLDGGSGADFLEGGSGDDRLDGGTGADEMRGGSGNDAYYVDNTGDVVIEGSQYGGIDTVISSVSFTLGANIENLTLTGSAVSGRGNGLDNVLTGNDADNFLRGKAGADVMIGGAGDDRYEVDDVGDQVVEASSSGRDWVYSSISYVLPANVEALTLTGEDWINATGNSKGNAIYGNSGRNVITGGRGSDVMTGKASSDTFVFTSILDSTLDDPDRITDLNDKSDKLDFRQIDGDVNTAGVQGFTIVDAFTGHAGELVLSYDASTDITSLTIDVNGDGVADMLVRLNGEHESFDRFLFGGG